MLRKAIIISIKGLSLSKREKNILIHYKPWGVILFSRNIRNILQAKKLTSSIRILMKDKNYPILIDQEGGKVNRVNSILNLNLFSQQYIGKLYAEDKDFNVKFDLYINKIAKLLNAIGVNFNTVPVLDISYSFTHNVIGDRSFSHNPKIVSILGNKLIYHYKRNKIFSIAKHIPGHGLAKVDSHFKTPVIKKKSDLLFKNDFYPFKRTSANFAMTAHVVYQEFDSKNTVTHSKIMINDIIRKKLKFSGALISDDISMKSLKFNLKENAVKAYDSGCNLLLHCNANIKETEFLCKLAPNIDKITIKNTAKVYGNLG